MRHVTQQPQDPEDIDDNEDLEPNAEDLEIFAEVDRMEEERLARIARGEPGVDPMVGYKNSLVAN